MHRSQPVFAVSGSPGELRTLSLPCYNDASTSQLQRQQDELDSDVMRVVATAARLRPPTSGRDLTEHASNGATGTLVHPLYTTLEYDGFRPASRGLITECVATAGLSGYSSYVGELANVTPPTFQLQQASSDVREYDRESVETPPPDKNRSPPSAAVQVATPSTVQQARCEVLQLADCTPARQLQENESTTTEDDSRLHVALQSQCAKLLRRDCSYADIENKLLPGTCTTAPLIMSNIMTHLALRLSALAWKFFFTFTRVPRPSARTGRPKKLNIGRMEAHHTANP